MKIYLNLLKSNIEYYRIFFRTLCSVVPTFRNFFRISCTNRFSFSVRYRFSLFWLRAIHSAVYLQVFLASLRQIFTIITYRTLCLWPFCTIECLVRLQYHMTAGFFINPTIQYRGEWRGYCTFRLCAACREWHLKFRFLKITGKVHNTGK